jgi:ABC-type Co2+ transport system permease subunit
MRALLGTPIVLLLAATAGYLICLLIGADPHLLDAGAALVVVLVASAAAAIPLILARHADQTGAAQAGLLATMIHLFVAAALAGVAILFAKRGQPFTYWLFAFYWTTLAIVAMESVRLVKAAPPARVASKQ